MRGDKDPIGLSDLYTSYMDAKNKENTDERYVGKEGYYHASGAGFCSRKLYYESIEKAIKTNEPNDSSKRKMRLGTIVHEDFQNALSELYIQNNIYIDNIYTEKKKLMTKKKIKFHIEGEIIIEELKVRGFYDIVAVEGDDGSVYLYDIKTTASFSWSKMFGRYVNNDFHNYKLQLGTYGYAIKKEFGRLDGMFLFFYNKDNSDVKNVEVPLNYTDLAYNYWNNINIEHGRGVPDFIKGISPVETWACGYCPYKNHCNPPNYKNK